MGKSKEPTNGYIVNTDKLAQVIGKTRQRVNQLAAEGVLIRGEPGKWDLFENARAYIAYLDNGRKVDTDLEKERQSAELLLKSSKAQRAELELLELQGKMHRSEDVQDMTTDLVLNVRSALMALPGRLAADLCPLKQPMAISERIRAEVNLVLSGLAEYQYDPEKYRERVRERKGWETAAGDDDG